LSAEGWRELAKSYPDMPANPGPAAARRRRKLERLASRALSTGRWNLELVGEPPGPSPCVYVTAHIGAMQALRYALRSRGIPAATVLGPHNLDRTQAIPQDRVFDRRHALDFPHALPSSAAHRLRAALKRGSLLAAADLPERDGVPGAVLGGPALLDPRPFRLARLAGVACRPAFATLPRGVWTLTLGPPLSGDPEECAAAFGRFFARVAADAPLDLDGVVYSSRARESAP
jgi:lauroyl/myristoyl acyltransferase